MYILACYYYRKHQLLIEEAIKHLPEVVFDCWHIIPTFKIDIDTGCDDDEFKFVMEYDDPKDDQNTVNHGHEAFSLAQAFISGWILAKGETLE
jgi:hypothetical protein